MLCSRDSEQQVDLRVQGRSLLQDRSKDRRDIQQPQSHLVPVVKSRARHIGVHRGAEIIHVVEVVRANFLADVAQRRVACSGFVNPTRLAPVETIS